MSRPDLELIIGNGNLCEMFNDYIYLADRAERLSLRPIEFSEVLPALTMEIIDKYELTYQDHRTNFINLCRWYDSNAGKPHLVGKWKYR